MLAEFVHKIAPVLIELGPVQIRYYGVVFAITLLLGFVCWRKQMLRGGHSERVASGFFVWGVLAAVIGARLGHCFFYDAHYYLQHPVRILSFWQGGLSSHGATIGLVTATALYAWQNRLSILEIMDRFTPSAAVGAAGVRFGNFLNSEIVGRATDLPWGVRFMYFDSGKVLRHPSQLYEFAMGLFVLAVLLAADRKAGREKRPLGMMTGLFFTVYFAGRFCVEFVKQPHTAVPDRCVFTMGQYLSILPFVFGVGLLVWAFRRRMPTEQVAAKAVAAEKPREPAAAATSARKVKPSNRSKKRRRPGR